MGAHITICSASMNCPKKARLLLISRAAHEHMSPFADRGQDLHMLPMQQSFPIADSNLRIAFTEARICTLVLAGTHWGKCHPPHALKSLQHMSMLMGLCAVTHCSCPWAA
eukprot:3592697-Rhodomonas_salina.4